MTESDDPPEGHHSRQADRVHERSGDRPSDPRHDLALSRVIRGALKRLGLVRNGEGGIRGALGELMDSAEIEDDAFDADERALLLNILQVRDRTAEDVMIPRAHIVAVDVEASLAEVVALMTETSHSRLPVFRETLDNAIGMVHIKDVLAWRGRDDQFKLTNLLRRVLFVAPSMEVLSLLLEMRATRSHMALVVDEFGGVDGLITIEDLIEQIVGDIADEHEKGEAPMVVRRPDGSLDADARAPVDALDEFFGEAVSEDDRDEIDTIGGLVVSAAGRVPIKGERIIHPAGLEFEVVDADPRRIRKLRVRRSETLPAATGSYAGSNGAP